MFSTHVLFIETQFSPLAEQFAWTVAMYDQSHILYDILKKQLSPA